MKILKFLKNNFQLVNFFLAALIVGMLYGWWYLPNSEKLSFDNTSNINNEKINQPTVKLESTNLPPIETPVPKPSSLEPIITEIPQPEKKLLLPELPPEYNSPYPPLDQQANYLAEQSSVTTPVKTNFGHFPFAESSRHRLVKVGDYYGRSESLDQEAASAFKKMQADAGSQGVKLTIISGFRSISSQEGLFQNQIKRKGGIQAAARYSAPPGHSEHHTGYALDIGDGSNPGNDLKVAFESTPAYQWLARNAPQYGFELSFPRGNSQGVSYEPWHWRYVASPRANEIFMAARSQS